MSDYQTLQDIDLVNKVKDENDSNALRELVSRHTGIYNKIINNYSQEAYNQRGDFNDNKFYNFYKAVKSYNPEKKMKFSVYLGESIKFNCMRDMFKNRHGPKFENLENYVFKLVDADECGNHIYNVFSKAVDDNEAIKTKYQSFDLEKTNDLSSIDRIPENTNALIAEAYKINETFGKIIEAKLDATNYKPITFKEVSKRTGISPKKISQVFNAHIKELQNKYKNDKIRTEYAD